MTTGSLQTFDFNEAPVRVMLRDSQPWFVAADVCRVLEIANSRDAIAGLDEDEKGVVNADGLRSNVGNADSRIPNRGMQIISESGLYALIFKSRKAEARKFRKWVTAEVLPAIRETGRYEVPPSCTAGDGVEVMSVLGFVRTRCTHLTIEAQMEFGLLVRRYAKAMGVIFQPVMEPGVGRVFGFARSLMEGLLTKVPQRLVMPDEEAQQMQVLLEHLEQRMGLGKIAAETVRHMAKQLGLFAWVWKLGSAPAVNSAFGRVIRRQEGRLFENGLCVRCHRTGERRMYEVIREKPELIPPA